MLSRAQYTSKPKFANLSQQEKDARYKQYKASYGRKIKPIAKNTIGPRPNPRPVNKILTASDKCLLKYAFAIVNPFDSEPSCTPWFPALSSQKVKVFARGTMYTGVNGWGWIVARPQPDNFIDAGYATKSTYSGTLVDDAPNLAYDTITNSNSTWDENTFDGGSNYWRCVSMGIRVRYVGTNLNQGGTIQVLETPGHAPTVNLTQSTVGQYAKAVTLDVTDSWTGITWTPQLPDEFEYINRQTLTGVNRIFPLLLSITTPTASQPFSYEVVSLFEAVGPVVQTQATPSWAHINGTANVASAASQLPTQSRVKGSRSVGAARSITRELIRQAAPEIEYAVSNLAKDLPELAPLALAAAPFLL